MISRFPIPIASRWLLLALALLSFGASAADEAPPPVWSARILASYPHDPDAFTQGLVYADGHLYESTGLYGRSSLRRVELTSGRVLQQSALPRSLFGEGITLWGERIIQLTWRAGRARVLDRDSFELLEEFRCSGEGWGITHDAEHWLVSDGSERLRVLDPRSRRVVRRLPVLDRGQPVRGLNELEWIDGEIWANIWKQDRIVRIDPGSGAVLGYLDLGNLWRDGMMLYRGRRSEEAVLNGIAYDATGDRLFVTGKLWPRLFQIEVVREGQ